MFTNFIFALTLVGTYGDLKAKLYDLKISHVSFGGNIIEKKHKEEPADEGEKNYVARMQGWFEFVQTEDGSIPVTRYSREEDPEVMNIKKAVVSAFQANFKGTKVKEEADPQSHHKAEYTYAYVISLPDYIVINLNFLVMWAKKYAVQKLEYLYYNKC